MYDLVTDAMKANRGGALRTGGLLVLIGGGVRKIRGWSDRIVKAAAAIFSKQQQFPSVKNFS